MANLEIPEDLDLSNLPDKQKILVLDKVFFKILASELDLDFEDNLRIWLPKLILKLSTNEEIVRKKIMEILVHVNKRIKSRPNVQLPLNDLLASFNDPNLAGLSFVANFSLIYIKLSFPRLSSKEKAEMVERLLKCLEGKPPTHQDSLLSLIVDGLKYLDLKQNDNSNIEKYGLLNSPKLRKQFLDYLFNFLLLPYSYSQDASAPPTSTNQSLATANLQSLTTSPTSQPVQPVQPEIPACLSESIFKQFKNDINLYDGDEIEEIKIGILKFLSFNIYNCEEMLFHFIISTSDTRYRVVNAAELHIKRIVGGVDLNELNIVSRFYQLFLGDKVIKKSTSINNIEPANTRIRLKLLPYMLKSRGCASTIPQSIQLVFDCLFGSPTSTNSKIKLYSVQFVHNMALYCESDKLSKIGALLIQGMNKLIAESNDDNKLRGLAYVAVGKLARKIPDTIANDISVVHNFFSALEKEDSDTKMNIQEALVLMIDAFRNKNKDIKSLLLTLLFQYIENEISQCRSMAVKYTFEIFDHDDLESRFLLLLATSDSKEEIRQEAVKYLRRTQDPDGNDLKMASFEKWVEFITNKIQERLSRNYKVYTFGTHTLAFEPNCYQEILTILRMALSKSANLKNAQIIDSKSLESSKDETPLLFNYVKKLSQENLNCLFKYVNIIKEYALTVGNPLGIYLLLEISSISPVNITKFLHENIEWLKNQSFSVNEQVRIYSSELWSLVLINNILDQNNSNLNNDDYSNVNFDNLFTTLDSINKTILANNLKSFETKHGSLLCIGFALGKFYNLVNSKLNNKSYIESIGNMISEIVGYLDDPNLSMAAIVSLGEIARNGPVIYKSHESKLEIVDVLNKKILTSKEKNRLKEKAAACLGYMSIHESLIMNSDNKEKSLQTYKIETKTFDSFNKYIMQKLLNSSQAKQIELNMTIGEALVNCALGKKSRARLNIWLTDFNSDELDDSNYDKSSKDYVDWLLNELLINYMQNQNQHLRQASCFWLLILVKKCSNLSEIVLKSLPAIQDAFISRLGENDEITQEVASKGVGVVFSLANDGQKKDLVSRLVETLGGGNSAKQKAQNKSTNLTSVESGLKITDENEQIFNPDQIGKAPDGTNITTYKEICSLASDLNKPDLIYQFMNLAHHNSVWNTRRGAAFGFNTISQLASEQLQPYLPSIVPKLYRYQFDPNPKIQQSMESIWNSLIKQDNKKILDQYLDKILIDLEENMLAPLWRVRESCCNALSDLLKGGRNLESISDKFGPFWSLLFKLADDIKESVRSAAELALKSLQRTTISYSTSVSNKITCEKTINSVLPVLILDGLQSNLNEVRNISVLTIRDLVKQSSSFLIKPYLVDLIINLLETLSGYEPPDLNYISLKLGSQDAQEKLDMARISSSKNTPMVEIINMNIEHLNDEQILADLIPKLIDIIKRGLGVSTKAGVCHVICTLVDQQPEKMSQYSGKILAALVNCMSNEQNKTINKCYCGCIGSIVKVAKDSSIENLLNKLQEWYFEREDEGIKLSCGNTLLAIAQNNNELIMKFSKKCIPFVFFAIHNPNEQQMKLKQQQQLEQDPNSFKFDLFKPIGQMEGSGQNSSSSVWFDVWEDITSGTEYAIRANISEILKFIKSGFEHQSWNLRIQSALAIRTICSKLQSNIETNHINEILSMLNSALSTRTWTGKHNILIAVSSLFINCKLKLNFENELVDEIIKSVFKEANKQGSNIDLSYRIYSVMCLSDLLQFCSAQFKETYFEQYWSMFVLKIFQSELDALNQRENQRQEQQIEYFKNKLNKNDEINMEEQQLNDKKEPSEENDDKMSIESETKTANKANSEEKMDQDEEKEEVNINYRVIVLVSLGKSWSFCSDMQEKYLYETILLLVDYLSKTTWTNQVLFIKSLDYILEKWSIEFEEKNVDNVIRSFEILTSNVINCIAKTKYSSLKRDGLCLLEKIVKILKNEKSSEESWNKLIKQRSRLDETIENSSVNFLISSKILETLSILFQEFSTDSNLDIKDKAKNLIKTLKTSF